MSTDVAAKLRLLPTHLLHLVFRLRLRLRLRRLAAGYHPTTTLLAP